MWALGYGWSHAREKCAAAADVRREAKLALEASRQAPELARFTGAAAPKPPAGGYALEARSQLLKNSYGPARMDVLLHCLDGGPCACGGPKDIECSRACGYGMHRKCLGVGKGAALGTLVCVNCRLDDLRATQPASVEVRRMAAEALFLEFTARKESTARGHLSVEKMQSNFLEEMLKTSPAGAGMAKPADNAAAMQAMLLWMIRSGRGSSLDAFVVSCQGYLVDTKRDNLFDLPSVKRTLKTVRALNPGVSLPATSGTRRLAKEVLKILPEIAATDFLAARETLMFSAECVTGARIGELAGAQVGHGVYANQYAILKWVGSHTNERGEVQQWDPPPGVVVGERFCEHDNETSKTDVPRVMTVVGETKGEANIHLADAVENYWGICQFQIEESREGGWLVRRPNFSVVQIALQNLRGGWVTPERLCNYFRTSRCPQIQQKAPALESEVQRLLNANDPTDSKMFLNLVGGPRNSPEIARAIRELKEEGVNATVALGPLFMKTCGKDTGEMGRGGSAVLPMPLLVKSTYEIMNKATILAYNRLAANNDDPDMVLGKGRNCPKFGHHSWRRLADTVATETLTRGECSAEDIDLHFGWKLKKYAKKMQLHYANRGKRTARAKLMEQM